MEMIIVIASILVITSIVWLWNKVTPFYVCPICAGVSGTWIWMLIGRWSGQLPVANYQLPIAILMGGSVAGIAYQIEKILPTGKSAFLWKTLFIPAGFFFVHNVVNQKLVLASWILAFIMLLTIIFLMPGEQNINKGKIEALKDKMKNCC